VNSPALAGSGVAPYILVMSYVARTDRPADKAARYAEVETEILAVLEGEPNRTARMATVASMLADAFETYFWTGFYLVADDRADELVVGPYQGTLGCLRIPFGRGVCGAAARTGLTQLVEDVHAFPGHIACDSRSRSEIVVPVRDASGALIAVFDVDATEPVAFDATDAQALERLMAKVFAAG
jgi:GAF domain-containing protein